MAVLTLLDLAYLQKNDALTGLVEDVTTYAPEFGVLPVTKRPGTTYKIVRRTAYPTVGFRDVNAGVALGASSFKQETKEMFYLDSQIQVDEAVVKGDDRTTGDILSHEAAGALQNALITIGTQLWYGTEADSKGFAGIRTQLAGGVAAGGTTNSSSAYLLWLNPWGVGLDVGRDGEIALLPFQRQQVTDSSDSTKRLMAWVSNLSCYIGLSVKSAKSTWAVVGITTTWSSATSNNAMSDQLAASLVAKIPLNRRQGLHWFMNRTAYYTLQRTRSALGYQPAGSTGAVAWAPRPTETEGYPITISDSIVDTETNVAS